MGENVYQVSSMAGLISGGGQNMINSGPRVCSSDVLYQVRRTSLREMFGLEGTLVCGVLEV